MEKEPKIVLNQIQTPDGTILKSIHRHDYVTYIDKNGLEYMVDGGTDYLRRNVYHTTSFWFRVKRFLLSLVGVKVKDPLAYTELTVYSNAPFEVIRKSLHRGGRGKDGTSQLTWVPLDQMNDGWVLACIQYNTDRGNANSFSTEMYRKELMYRQEHGIEIPESE